MDQILTLITDKLGPMGPVIVLGFLGAMMILATIPSMMKKRADPLDKLRASIAEKGQASQGSNSPQLRQSGSKKLEKYANFLEPKSAEEMTTSRKWLQSAGYKSPTAVRTFHAIQFGMGLGFLALGVIYAMLSNAKSEVGISSTQMIMSVLLPGAFGYYAPKRWVNKRIEARKLEIQQGFPDALDMLLVCVEAGQSLDQGIIRVSKELVRSYPALAEEFETVSHEIKAGLDKPTVLRAFGERSGVQDVQSFVTVMIQSQQFGTSIAEALRLYAADMRDKRVLRAEEAANKIPTKMTLGTMMFTVPPLLIILVGPSVYDMMENFKSIGR